MSSITTDQGSLHYEVFGRGKPVILLHGWLGSWGLWHDSMTFLGDDYRTYAMDFWGFGDSGKKRSSYEIDDFVDLVEQFMEELGIAKAPVIGHSMGGTVALAFAIKHPERVSKVAVIGSPIHGSSLDLILKLFGMRPVAYVVHNFLWALKLGFRIAAPVITTDKNWFSMMEKDLSKTTLDSFLLSIASLRNTDLRSKLDQIKIPTMGMFGRKDVLVDPEQWRPLVAGVPTARIERFRDAGHFPMLDQPELFKQTLKNFLDTDTQN